MMEINIKTNLEKEFRNFLRSTDGRVTNDLRRGLKRSMNYIINRIASNAPYREFGKLKRDILEIPISSIQTQEDSGFVLFGNGKLTINLLLNRRKDKKIIWVNDGTGKYGPNKTRIIPVRAKFLRFEIDGKWIRVRSTKGMKGRKFIEAGIKEARPFVIKELSKSIGD